MDRDVKLTSEWIKPIKETVKEIKQNIISDIPQDKPIIEQPKKVDEPIIREIEEKFKEIIQPKKQINEVEKKNEHPDRGSNIVSEKNSSLKQSMIFLVEPIENKENIETNDETMNYLKKITALGGLILVSKKIFN